MLKKLIKYDFRSTWREFAAIYLAILLGVTLFPIIGRTISSNAINAFIGIIAFAIIVAVIVVTIGSLFKIYNKNVFSNEGYLTMTLPVNETQIVLSKLIVSSFWLLLTGVVSALGLLIFISIMSPEAISEMLQALRMLFAQVDAQGWLALVMAAIFVLASTLQEVAKLFMSCTVAHLKQLNRFRVPAGILSYFLFTWLEFAVLDLVNLGPAVAKAPEDFTSCGQSIEYSIELFNRSAATGTVFELAFTALFAAGIIYLLKRKLNLD